MRFVRCIFFLLLTHHLYGEPDPRAIREIPIQFRDGHLWAKVNIAHRSEPLDFLVDSGASVSVVNLGTANRLGLELGGKVKVSGIRATVNGYWPVALPAKAGRVDLPSQYLALDLSKLSRACGRSVDGLLGADFFRDRVIQIDYRSEKLRILDKAPLEAGASVVPLQVRRCGLRVSLEINGSRGQWVRLDTGCATALHWVTSKVSAAECTTRPAVGLTETSFPHTSTRVRLGAEKLNAVQTAIHRRHIFPGESGLLGNGLLVRFGVVTIDARSGRLFLGH